VRCSHERKWNYSDVGAFAANRPVRRTLWAMPVEILRNWLRRAREWLRARPS
jgi:hypothetical protein